MKEEALIEIETKLSWQEDLLTKLNELLYRQQEKIGDLDKRLEILTRRVIEMNESIPGRQQTEKPPHY